MTLSCPCCSGRAYEACCRPFHKDSVEPPTPEALMRSRYSAFALKQTDHLWRTLHSSHPDRKRRRDDVIRELRKNCNRFRYPALRILSVEDSGEPAFVTFHATVMDGPRDVGFTERSRFLREDGGWKYVDGTAGAK